MSQFSEFSKQAQSYSQFRPSYPSELYSFLSQSTPSHQKAYDIGTGNGQCARELARYYDYVFASDLSPEQISHAQAHNKIKYFVAPAEDSGLDNSSIDLITVATAIHWFPFESFYKECKRILKPEGVIAAWSYGWHECENSEVTKIYEKVGKEVLASYWSEPPKLIWDGYKRLPFPFESLSNVPTFKHQVRWNLAGLIGYLSTWSASQKFIDKNGIHPAESLFPELLAAWGNPQEELLFSGPLHLKIGRNSI